MDNGFGQRARAWQLDKKFDDEMALYAAYRDIPDYVAFHEGEIKERWRQEDKTRFEKYQYLSLLEISEELMRDKAEALKHDQEKKQDYQLSLPIRNAYWSIWNLIRNPPYCLAFSVLDFAYKKEIELFTKRIFVFQEQKDYLLGKTTENSDDEIKAAKEIFVILQNDKIKSLDLALLYDANKIDQATLNQKADFFRAVAPQIARYC